jgi:tRNA dimethylallyltransferase
MAALTVPAIFGPTGVGKTAVAIALAQRLRRVGEDPVAVSADALQLYAGLELVTGAASREERALLEHRLVGVLPLDAVSSAGAYAEMAHAEIDALLAAGRRPIVVGGTGLYLRAAVSELDLRPPADPRVRERLNRELERHGAPALHAALAARDPDAAARVARTDSQRIVRALELLEAGQAPPADGESSRLWSADMRHPTLMAGVVMERAALYARIDARVDAMVAAGAREEVERAAAAGASPGARQALGFHELLDGDIERMKRRTRNYAKRQLTWMRKLPGTLLLDATHATPDALAERLHDELTRRDAAGPA